MKRKVWSPVLTVLLMFAAVPAFAQPMGPMKIDVPRLLGQFAPSEGVWAKYSVVDREAGKESIMRMAIVGKEEGSHWYEVWLDEAGSRNIIKLLVAGDPNNPENIQRMIMKIGESPPIEMPRDFVVRGRKVAVSMFETRSGVGTQAESGIKIEKTGEREVTVPAGTFTTTLNRIVDNSGRELGTFDMSAKVPPFGVVVSETPKVVMKLLAYGSDAETGITEDPLPMAAPPGMPEGMPRGRPPGMTGPPPDAPPGGPPQIR